MTTARMQQRRDTAANWASFNPVLLVGEMAVETDTLVVKVGDGVTAYNLLKPILSATYAPVLGAPITLTADGPLTIGKPNRVDASAASRTVSLPDGTIVGQDVPVERIDATLNTLTITGKIRSASASTLPLTYQYETIRFVWTGAYWEPLTGHRTKSSIAAQAAQVVATGPGLVSIVNGAPRLTITTPWGIRANGTAYYTDDPAGAPKGEAAVLDINPATGAPRLTLIGA